MVLGITARRDGGGSIAFGRRSVVEAIALAERLESEGFDCIQVTDLDTAIRHWPLLVEEKRGLAKLAV